MPLTSHSLTYGLTKYNNVNLVFKTTKMTKATNVLYKMVWKARKDGQCLARMKHTPIYWIHNYQKRLILSLSQVLIELAIFNLNLIVICFFYSWIVAIVTLL